MGDFPKTTCADIANAMRDACEEWRMEAEAESLRRLKQNVEEKPASPQKTVDAKKTETEALPQNRNHRGGPTGTTLKKSPCRQALVCQTQHKSPA